MNMKPTQDELLAAIHKHCLACSGGSRKEVHRCKQTACALWLGYIENGMKPGNRETKKDKFQFTDC